MNEHPDATLRRRVVAMHGKGVSARKISQTCGISRSTVARWVEEDGRSRRPAPAPAASPFIESVKAGLAVTSVPMLVGLMSGIVAELERRGVDVDSWTEADWNRSDHEWDRIAPPREAR